MRPRMSDSRERLRAAQQRAHVEQKRRVAHEERLFASVIARLT